MSDALQTGLYLTVAGMGLVFLVLAMLWGLIVLLLRSDQMVLPHSSVEEGSDAGFENGGRVRTEVVAAISTAIYAYEADKRRRVRDVPRDVASQDDSIWLQTGRAQQLRDWQPKRWN